MAAANFVLLGGAIVLAWCATAARGLGDGVVVDGDVTDMLPCMESLAPCETEMALPTPTPACCDPMKDLIKHDRQCVCSMFFDDRVLASINVTREKAVDMRVKCGINIDRRYCDGYVNGERLPSPLVSIFSIYLILRSSASIRAP
ncbi:Protease inhibitor seed storage lipid transfer protein (LTP) family protein [Musa troglodytarum]|uniref:Protease inhibitor seed storage lipid transfer protein (LTP) family protein n=1 Tax=Musa troglodytarum TaxID=320322 RepID=A0A9E7LDP2_9LILI|nr:Protease inhibitor seed storage lipid transfer protein (LTP) family protein [Musa troglodytarum]